MHIYKIFIMSLSTICEMEPSCHERVNTLEPTDLVLEGITICAPTLTEMYEPEFKRFM